MYPEPLSVSHSMVAGNRLTGPNRCSTAAPRRRGGGVAAWGAGATADVACDRVSQQRIAARILIGFAPADDVAHEVRAARIDGVGPQRLLAPERPATPPRGVVRERTEHFLGDRMYRDPFRPIHVARADDVSRGAGVDQHLGLRGEAGLRCQTVLALRKTCAISTDRLPYRGPMSLAPCYAVLPRLNKTTGHANVNRPRWTSRERLGIRGRVSHGLVPRAT